MTSEDRKDSTRYLPNLWHSLVQLIIQSRLGEKVPTSSTTKSPVKGSSMFNLEIIGDESVTQSVKKCMGNEIITQDNPFSLEILLHTKEGKTMVLEVWTLSIEDNLDSSSQKICQMVTDRMSVLLKSAVCVSRITPAYRLSFRQSYDSYIILYKLYTGKPDYSSLGENSVHVKVGQTNIQSAYLSIHLSYRTVLTFPSQPRVSSHDQMMLKSDHFKVEASPKYHRRPNCRTSESSDAIPTSDESQEGSSRLPFNGFDANPSPRSRTNSEGSKGLQPSISTERLFVPFAGNTTTTNNVDEFFLPEDFLLSNGLLSGVADLREIPPMAKERKPRLISETESESEIGRPKASEKPQMNSSDHSSKSFASNATKEDNEYVVVDLKTPFVEPDLSDTELSTFYRECQTAPPLHMFTDEPEQNSIDDSICLNEQIKCFENCVDEYEDLVKSLNLDEQSSQELR